MRKKPNVIFIVADEQRHDSLSAAGHPVLQTPNIDALAVSGTRCENAFTASALCVPSRVSMFTGQYVHRTHSLTNDLSHHIQPPQLALPEILKRQGYHIGLAGKNHAFNNAYLEKWFDYREEYGHWGKEVGEITDTDREVIRFRHNEQRLAFTRTSFSNDPILQEGLIEGAEPFPREQCSTWRIAEDSIRFIEQNRAQPFMLYCSFPDPHFPCVVCEPYHSMYDPVDLPDLEAFPMDWGGHPFKHYVQSQASGFDAYNERERKEILCRYYGMLTFIDDAVGALLSRLEELDLAKDTIVIYCADHGNFAGRYGLVGKTGAFYDSLVRIPLIFRVPGQRTANRTPAMLSNIDIVPTLLDYLGIEQSERMQGRSFRACLEGCEESFRDVVFAELGTLKDPPPTMDKWQFESYRHMRHKKDGVFWFVDYTANGRIAMIRTDHWKYNYYIGDREELYDLAADPLELTNLAADSAHGAQKEALKNQLLEWLLTTPHGARSGFGDVGGN